MHPMSNRTDARYRAGGPMDDVARNIRNEQHADAIDRNPMIACDRCGDNHPWMDYWKDRVNQMDGDPREEPWHCDDCKANIRRLERRRRYHMQLREFGHKSAQTPEETP